MSLHLGDALEYLRSVDRRYSCIIADPPDNLGLQYNSYRDKRDPEDYYQWLGELMRLAVCKSQHFWLSYYWQHDLRISHQALVLLRQGLCTGWKKYIWRFTFGQHKETDCGSGYRILLRLSQTAVTPPERVESERQRLGDSRADPRGRVPDDVWEFPRVVGNSAERRRWHPTQHPEGVYKRLGVMSGSREPGFSVLDLFAGTGTVFRVFGKSADGVEIDPHYCSEIVKEHGVELRKVDKSTL